MTHHTVLIVGGGAAGVSVANNMRRQNATIDIAIIEPSEKHYYQPGFTIIGGGAYTLKKTTRNEADLIHPSVQWIKEYADTFQPEENGVTLRSGEVVSYDYLVVCIFVFYSISSVVCLNAFNVQSKSGGVIAQCFFVILITDR